MPEGTIEKEIAQLEEQLAAKRQALEAEDGREQEPSGRELVHEAVGERIKEQEPSYQPAPAPGGAAPKDGTAGASWQDPAIAQQVQTLVNTAFTGGVDAAIGDALKTHNPAIIDAFHDLLRDRLVGELIKRGKLRPPSS